MRYALVLFVLACSSDPADPGDPGPGGDPPGADAGTPPAANTYRVEVPSFTLAPGEEKTVSYYTTLANAEAIGVTRYASHMAPGSHHLILYTFAQATQPDGALVECGGVAGGSTGTNFPVWAYASQTEDGELDLPSGVGIGMAAHQPVMVNAHYLNTSEAPLTTSITIDIEAHPPGTSFTPAAAFVTYNTLIDVAPGQTGSASGSCAVPSGAQFFLLSTHSHRFTETAKISDGTSMILETEDWEHPTVGLWDADPFLSFSSGRLDYRCDYYNDTSDPIRTGDSALTDEMCMAIGYFFPASTTVACLNSTLF